MKKVFLAGAAVLAFGTAGLSGARAQTPAAAEPPELTEGQARSIAMDSGINNISTLTKDRHDAWHGTGQAGSPSKALMFTITPDAKLTRGK